MSKVMQDGLAASTKEYGGKIQEWLERFKNKPNKTSQMNVVINGIGGSSDVLNGRLDAAEEIIMK
jgi:hypothetical protein